MHARLVEIGMVLAAATVLGACGAGRGGPEPPPNDRPGPGGTLSVLGVDGIPSLDPHVIRTGLDAMLHRALYRQLYVLVPGESEPVPDLAAGPPEVADDGRTVTVVLRRRARFSDDGTPITAADVKRGTERALGLESASARGWRRAFASLDGVAATSNGGAITGIEAPTPERLVLRLRRPGSLRVIAGLATPASTPVRAGSGVGPSAARGVDPSGPYILDVPGVSAPIRSDVIRLRRGPGWTRDADVRPAYADAITLLPRRGAGTALLATAVFEGRGQLLFSSAPSAIVRLAEQRARDQVTTISRPVTRYVAFAAGGLLADRDVRRALLAATDRGALLRASGARAELASHFLPPGVAGHDESGGVDGTGAATLREPQGDLRLAQSLLRSAGFVSGRLPRVAVITAIRAPGATGARATRVLARSWRPLGVRLLTTVLPAATARRACDLEVRRARVCISAVVRGEDTDAAPVLAPLLQSRVVAPIRSAAAQAAQLPPGALRDRAWAGINRALVDQAVGVPWRWDEEVRLVSRDVLAVVEPQTGLWDLPFTSLDARSR